VHVPEAEVDASSGRDRRRVPRTSPDDLLPDRVDDRVECPEGVACLLVERIDHAAAEECRRREVHLSVRDLRLDVDPEAVRELTAAVAKTRGNEGRVPPELATGVRVERERELRRRAVDDAIAHRDAVRADVLRVVSSLPENLAGCEV